MYNPREPSHRPGKDAALRIFTFCYRNQEALVDTYFSLPTGTLKFSIKSAVHLKPLRIMGISLLCPFYRQGNREEETPGLATWNGGPGTCLRLSSEHFSLSRGYRWGLPAQL